MKVVMKAFAIAVLTTLVLLSGAVYVAPREALVIETSEAYVVVGPKGGRVAKLNVERRQA